MSCIEPTTQWADSPPVCIGPAERESHVRYCSLFADETLNRYPDWLQGLDRRDPPSPDALNDAIERLGTDAGLRQYRNRQMLRIIWNDLCGLVTLGEVFSDLTRLAEICLQAAVDENSRQLREKFGTPRDTQGVAQDLIVIGMGKFGGYELNLSSDIDVMFCYPSAGECDGRRNLSNDQFFIRLARQVISSLSEMTGDGFCFRVDARLRPFGDAGPLASSIASMEQYYQREGRDWERYALIKARAVAGDRQSGNLLLQNLRPFVYRRYIDFGSVEAMQELHSSVHEDARRTDRLDDIKRGPGGIREIEFLAQCFQILRGGREVSLQTPSLFEALSQIENLALMPSDGVEMIRQDYMYLRRLENRIQALRDQQTHRLPAGEDRERMARAMGMDSAEALCNHLGAVRKRVSDRFENIFPEQPESSEKSRYAERWKNLQTRRQDPEEEQPAPETGQLGRFLKQLDRQVLSQRAHDRLDRFMPILLEHIDTNSIDEKTLVRVLDLVLAVCRRSAYLVLLVQHVPALSRILSLFSRSEWIAEKVIRFPALLDDLIDPSLGTHIPDAEEMTNSIDRLLKSAQGTEVLLEGLNYFKLATGLRIAVAQLETGLEATRAQQALTDLAGAILHGVLNLASREIEARHGLFASSVEGPSAKEDRGQSMAIIAYGTLGAGELGYESDLDLVFLFGPADTESDGPRPLFAERYYARLAQRVLSFLTVMTPSGKLYEVDTRLRPNGRAGALVSSMTAFRTYQLNEAWTWEMQALTRACFVTGNRNLEAEFNRVRADAVCRPRAEDELRQALREMRLKMAQEHRQGVLESTSLKHGPGGLVDIEFIAQMGVLASARSFPRALQATGTLDQLDELKRIGWLTSNDCETLQAGWLELSEQRMMNTLVRTNSPTMTDTDQIARLFESKIGR